jgi:hypothetical protein
VRADCLARILFVVVCALAVACNENAPTAPTPVDVQFTLSPGETAAIDGTAVGLRFERVTGDSRCPIDGVCIQGGDAIVHISIVAPASTTAYELHTGDMRPVRHGDLTIALVELQPYPFSARPTEPAEYRATFHVTR